MQKHLSNHRRKQEKNKERKERRKDRKKEKKTNNEIKIVFRTLKYIKYNKRDEHALLY